MPPPPPSATNQPITNFFKRFTIPKDRRPVNDVVEDEIVVAASKVSSQSTSPTERYGSPSSSMSSQNSGDAASPRAASPSPTPQKRTRLSQLDGGKETVPLVNGTDSSQTRVLRAIEIRSPPRPPPPPQSPKDAVERAPGASFSSTSTVSSVPMSSASSSRRIVKNGINAITNSDSGSADSDSEELADPSSFIVRKRRKLTPPGGDADHALEIIDPALAVRQSGRLFEKDRQSSASSKSRLLASPPRPVYKHSLLSLVKQREKEEKAVLRMKEAEEAFGEAQKKRDERMKQDQDLSSGLRAATADDSDEGDRMLLAMQRTEALLEDAKFHYFRHGSKRDSTKFLAIYDPADETSRPWMRLLRREGSRKQAFLSGFVADMAAKDSLPTHVFEWIMSEIMYEKDTDLCEAYTEVLQACTSRTTNLESLFYGLDYFYNTLEDAKGDDTNNQASRPDGPPPGLRYVFRVVQHFSSVPEVQGKSIAPLIVSLALAGADEYVKGDAAMLNGLHDTVESVLDAEPKGEWFDAICESVHEAFFAHSQLSAQLRCQIVSSLPALSERTHHLRRSLALHLVAGFTRRQDYRCDTNSSEWVEIIRKRLESALEFNISQVTNYALLDSLIEVLDIALDAGFSKAPSGPSLPAPNKSGLLLSTRPTIPTAESVFNSQIDTLTQQLRLMSSRIRGSGTSHLRRMEAKSSLERLIMRLEHSVRTRPKARKGVFGGATGEQRAFLSGFLKTASAKQREENERVNVVPQAMVSDREVDGENETSGSTSAVSGAEST